MSEFVVYPAIDLRFGKVVRLRQGKGDQQTVFGDNSGAVAQKWIGQGAEWLHVVNLNSALEEETGENKIAIKQIISAGEDKVKIQLGGGIRTMTQIKEALAMGITRVVLGTAVIEDADFGEKALNIFGAEKIAFGFDAIGQELMSHGWQSRSGLEMGILADQLAQAGARTLIYTNIRRDGMQKGVDWKAARHLSDQTKLNVIASGGVGSLDDIVRVKTAGLAGVIVGRALYEEIFTLKEAINAG